MFEYHSRVLEYFCPFALSLGCYWQLGVKGIEEMEVFSRRH